MSVPPITLMTPLSLSQVQVGPIVASGKIGSILQYYGRDGVGLSVETRAKTRRASPMPMLMPMLETAIVASPRRRPRLQYKFSVLSTN